MYESKLFVFFILLSMVCRSYELPYQNKESPQLFQQRSPEHDNRYVWFTRDVHDEDDSANQQHMLFKRWYKLFLLKNSKTRSNQFESYQTK